MTAKPTTAAEIMAAVCEYYDAGPLNVKSRRYSLVHAKSIAAYLMRQMAGMTLNECALVLNVNHATICHREKKITFMIKYDQQTQEDVAAIAERLKTTEKHRFSVESGSVKVNVVAIGPVDREIRHGGVTVAKAQGDDQAMKTACKMIEWIKDGNKAPAAIH